MFYHLGSFVAPILEVLTILFQVIVLMDRVHFIRIIIFQRLEGTLRVKKFEINGKKSILMIPKVAVLETRNHSNALSLNILLPMERTVRGISYNEENDKATSRPDPSFLWCDAWLISFPQAVP